MPDLRAYPFDRWPSISREEAARSRTQARGGPLPALARGCQAAADWLGTPLVLTLVAPPSIDTLEALLDPVAAVLLHDPRGNRAALVLDPTLASVLVDRTLGGQGEGLDAVAGPLREIERGVLAYALARWLAGSGSPYVVAAVLTSAIAVREALGPSPHEVQRLELQLADARGPAALWSSTSARAPELPRRLPTWATELPIPLAVRASTVMLTADELSRLEVGDVVLPERASLASGANGLTGRVWLQPVRGCWEWEAELVAGELRLTGAGRIGASAPVRASAEEDMVKDTDHVLEKLGGTPVTLSLELARFALPLAELAALGAGEVLRTGQPIGARVALRAGERVVATGELVEVEGEIGVRILELGA